MYRHDQIHSNSGRTGYQVSGQRRADCRFCGQSGDVWVEGGSMCKVNRDSLDRLLHDMIVEAFCSGKWT